VTLKYLPQIHDIKKKEKFLLVRGEMVEIGVSLEEDILDSDEKR
jgi:hypothetical protein